MRKALGRNFGISTTRGGTLTRLGNNNRRNRRRSNRNGIEINRAEGGRKAITLPYRTQSIGVNLFGRLLIQKIGEAWYYRIGMEKDNYAGRDYIDIAEYLNFSDEFRDRLQVSSQYLIKGISVTISYDRVPSAKDRLSTLLLYYDTDKITVQSPRIQPNVMSLKMNMIGTKNFNIRLNRQNTKVDDLGWQDAAYLYAAKFNLHVNSIDENYMEEQNETTIILGSIKISIEVLTRISDYMRPNAPAKKIDLEEKVKELTQELEAMKVSLVPKQLPPIKEEEEEKLRSSSC
jgi:hypothetical protein